METSNWKLWASGRIEQFFASREDVLILETARLESIGARRLNDGLTLRIHTGIRIKCGEWGGADFPWQGQFSFWRRSDLAIDNRDSG